MERTSTLSASEIVGVAAASAAALGGVIVALGRSQAASAKERAESIDTSTLPHLSRDTVEHGVERGRDLARSAASSLAAAYPDLRESAADLLHRAADTARPRASQVGSSASATAEHVRATGATVIERLHDDVLPAATGALSGLVERAGEARERSQPVAGDVKSVVAAKADAALTKSTSAGKDTLATLAWTATALTLVYFVLLSPERREQLKSFLWGAFDQAHVLLRDFQGYEDEF